MYVVLIGLCILVFSTILPKSKSAGNEGSSPRIVKEVEETMEGFLAEVEEDNRKLIDTIASMKQDHGESIRKLTDRIEGMEKQFQEERQDWRRLAIQRVEQHEDKIARDAAYVNQGGAPGGSASTEREPARKEHAPGQPPSGQIPERTLEEETVSAPEPAPVLTIRSRYEELFQLYEDGKSVEYIAKKTGLNKGEVSLIIQLAQQEELKGVEK
ncbi:MAG: hypothetical protein K0R57_3609 [Paenibacillaceae bacterium]|jgi:hypothetical protein|nr:hypothetical protein [Paenibacillaceae bacterium]